ncbi:MAG: ArgE/DapE family deacylase [Candidatus Eisenbacteria sp.]|nr:ArgE/DapE family deacylase [Candidatus Eisenbacteria bacterium]
MATANAFDDPAFARADERIETARETALELLEELVRIPSVNPPGDHYLECALLLAERLRELDFEPHTIEVPAHELERLGLPGDRPRPSVIAALEPDKPGEEPLPTLHFHGHYDVVPAHAPSLFELSVQDDLAYGRGTADMKGGLVAMLLACSALRPLRNRLRGRVLLSLVPDEETGGDAGTAHLFRTGVLADGGLGMLMPEPTGTSVWNGNRGAFSLLLTVRGKSAHVAVQHQGRNAFEGLLELGGMLEELKQEIEARTFSTPTPGLEGPPSILLLGGVCRGGVNFNLVPSEAQFSIDRRFHPDESSATVVRELEGIFRRFRRRGWKLDVEWLQRGDASLTPAQSPFGRELATVIDSVTGRETPFSLCPGILETRYFLHHGIPAVAYGPGELEHSHQPDEHVSITRILEVARIYARMAWRMVGPDAGEHTEDE